MTKRWLVVSSILALAGCFVSAQSMHRSDEVTGMSGMVRVLPNLNAAHTTVVFTSNTPLSPGSSQIVFVMQEDNSSVPPAWVGSAKVLTGDGFVAVVPDENSGPKLLLKFSDREVPPSLANHNFQAFDIVGIARYGEKVPLTAEQITSLATTGRNCGPVAQSKTKEFFN